MPVDDQVSESWTQLNTSSGSAELRAEASEFVPKSRNREDRPSRNGIEGHSRNDNSRKKKYTGAIPKSASSSSLNGDNRRRNQHQQPPRFQNRQNLGQNGRFDDVEPRQRDREREDPRETSSGVKDQKFFKDNQNYYGSKSSSNEGYYARNNGYDNHRQQQRNRWDDRRHYEDRHENHRDDRREDHREDRRDNHRDNRREHQPKKSASRENPSTQKRPPTTPKKENKKKSIEPSMISQREQLIKDIEGGKLECMICCDMIRDFQSTWNCTNCYHILHMKCINTWISNSKTDSGEWRCVACQFLRTEVPRDYICFCGKQRNPAVNRNDLAHSCGEQCGRTDNCVHPCTLFCHPGPHAICQSFVQRFCPCGKSSRTFQCSMKETFECEDICGKTLSCGVHNCQESCHQGECKPCEESIEMKCFCAKESKTETCCADNALITKYSCSKVCDLPLGCNNHRCELTCHPQKCGTCLLSPEFIKTCPCGQTKVEVDQRTSCTDPIPLCRGQCAKTLKCGPLSSPHACTKSCHLGECQPCGKSTSVKCRCGRIEEKIACKELTSTDVRCKKKCIKFKTCGKHKCNQNCCIEIEHLCSQQCGRMLECKKHRCQRPCHIGNCTPCQRASFEELRCECGTAVVYPPVPCGTQVPECTKKCARIHRCSHPVNHLCHSEMDCPPCVFLTTKACYGKHEERKTIPCNQDSFSCGMSCDKRLKCGRHKCIKQCHQNECEKSSDVCKQPCTIKRECGHNCNAPCHGDACPEKSCREKMEVTCQCGNLKETRTCEQVAYENRKIQRVKLAMQAQESVEFKDICEDASKKTVKILECDNECATLERNRRLDIAFKVENPNLINYPKFTPNYTEFIKTFYKKEPAFTKGIHEKLTELVKLAKESKQKSRSYSFQVMNRDKRHAVHDLAAMFGVETAAYDAEPNRNVIATASRESVS